jgi:hypothetical protein
MMLKVICQKCGFENEPEATQCLVCQAPLVQLDNEPRAVPDGNDQGDFSFHSPEGQDLPDLLKSLKQEGENSSGEPLFDESKPGLRDEEGAIEASNSTEEDLPAWLRRIRERAKKESDAAGEITQKLTAARESLDMGISDEKHEDFATWIQSLRGDTDEAPGGSQAGDAKPLQPAAESEEDSLEWLDRVRKLRGPSPQEGALGESERKGDSLLQWLVALEEGQVSGQPIPAESGVRAQPDEPIEPGESLGEAESPSEATQKIPVIQARRQDAPVVDASREEQLQANLFSSMVMDEGAGRPLREPLRTTGAWAIRLITALLVIALLSTALFLGWPGEAPHASPPPGQAAILSALEDLPEPATLLVVAAYQAGFSEEVHLVAQPILAEAISVDSEVSLVSSEPSCALLARRLLAGLPQAGQFSINELGYVASPVFGAYAIAGTPGVEKHWVSPLAALPPDLDGVFLLADSYEGAQFWVEQFSSKQPDVPLYLLVTAQAGPMLAPYWTSGQVRGMIAGISGIEILEGQSPREGMELHLRSAYQVGTLLLAVVIAAGAILGGHPIKGWKRGERHGLE